MRVRTTLTAVAVAMLVALAAAQGAPAQSTPPAGLGDQLFSTGGEITVEVLRSTAGLRSELRLYANDDTFTPIALNTEVGRVVTLPARPRNEELVFGIYVIERRTTFKMGPAERNPDGLAHAVVKPTGERRYDVGFEDLLNGGDRDYDDNSFRFSGGLAPNRSPVAGDQSLTTAQGSSLELTLTATDEDGDALTYAVSDGPKHGSVTGTGSALTYTPEATFSGLDTFGFTVDDGTSAPAEGRITIDVTPAPVVPPGAAGPSRPPGSPGPTTGAGLGDCPAGELTLVNVRRIGRRVRLTGLAERTLAGAPVSIVEGGLTVARTVIAADGSFKVRVALPALRGGRVLRYQARIGALRSRNLRLRRRMVTTSAGLRSGRIVIRGHVVNARKARRRPVVALYARARGCGTSYRRIGRARLRSNGRFAVSARPLQGVDVAVYRVSARLPGLGRSYTLPQTIARRQAAARSSRRSR